MRFKERRLQKVDKRYNEYLSIFENYLNEYFNNLNNLSPVLKNAMEYSVKNGGKRIRPVLTLAVADMLGIDFQSVLNYALAIEMVHSYSLVHDDLPCMDNDDYRRGKLSTHKKFGEALGVLTGDALLNSAFEVALISKNLPDAHIKAVKTIFELAGAKGMISGQVLDLESENKSLDEETLIKIYTDKTCKLLIAPVVVPSIIANDVYYDNLTQFAFNLGVMFQISDDILDVEGDFELLGKSLNKDLDSDKFTAIKLWGLGGAKQKAEYYYNQCINNIKDIPNNQFLLDFTYKIYTRKR